MIRGDKLAAWLRQSSSSARQVSVEQLLPLVGAETDYTPVFRVGVEYFGLADAGEGLTPQERAVARPLPTAGSVTIPNRPAGRSAALRRTLWLSSARAEFADLRAHLENLIELVSIEIG